MSTKLTSNYYPHHIPDSIVRSLLPHDDYKLQNCKPDGILAVNNIVVVFEYENSSRGMLSHTVKYMHLVSKTKLSVHVCFIESLFYQKSHNKDFEMSQFCSKFKDCINSDERNISFNFYKCNGYADNITHIVNKVKRKILRR